MGEVPKAEGVAAQRFKPAVDRLGRPVRCPVGEVGKDVGPPQMQRPPELGEFLVPVQDAGADSPDQMGQDAVPLFRVRVGVSADQSLIDRPRHSTGMCAGSANVAARRAPRRSDNNASRVRKYAVSDTAGPLCARGDYTFLLHPLAIQVELSSGGCRNVERIHHRHRVGNAAGGGALVTTEFVHGHHLQPAQNAGVRWASHPVKAAAQRPSTKFSNRAGPVPSTTGVRSTMTVTKPSPAARRVSAPSGARRPR